MSCVPFPSFCRSQLEKFIAAARIRLRELDSNFRMSKRELRRARKTVKTYEMMVAMGKVPGAHNQDQGSDTARRGEVVPAGPPQPQVIKIEPSPVTSAMVSRDWGCSDLHPRI